jgi:hypothetical protein
MSKKKKILLVLLGIAIGLVGTFWYFKHEMIPIKRVMYICADQKKLDVSFYKKGAVLHVENDKKIFLTRDLKNNSATRYRTVTNSMTLWENKDFVMVEEGDAVLYYECSIGGPQGDGLQNPAIDIPANQIEVTN